jgi:hypothetical protein
VTATASRRDRAGRVDPRVDPFTDAGASIRERQVHTALRLRKEGHTFAEIGRVLFPAARPASREDWARIFVRSADPKLLTDTRHWRLARRARLLAQYEREQVGPGVYMRRIKAVVDAQQAGDLNILIGSLHDQAAAAVAWALWLADHRD